MKIKKTIYLLILISALFAKTVESKISANQNKRLKQAKTLKQNGLIEEAIIVYNNLFQEYPHLHEAFSSLKILISHTYSGISYNFYCSFYKLFS